MSSLDVTKNCRCRDMRGSKVFRRAIDLFGDSSIIRKRIFNSPPENGTILKAPQSLASSSLANSAYAKPRVFPKKEREATSVELDTGVAEVVEYQEWLKRRKGMRAQLEQIGNVEKWLTGKDCTPSEKKLLQSLQSRDVSSSASMHHDKAQLTSGKSGEGDEQMAVKSIVKKLTPVIKLPPSQAIHKIEEYIKNHRLRLVDMFTRMDKNKDWLISCSECKQLFKKLKIPITDAEVEEFIAALDRNNDGYLDYRELIKARSTYKTERQRKKKVVVEVLPQVIPQFPQMPSVQGSSSGDIDKCAAESVTTANNETTQSKRDKLKSKQKQQLREAKKSPQNSTQSIRMKQHIAPSTLHEPIAQQVDHYRQEELKQFQNLLLYCKTHGIVLNQSLLERALLSPGDQDCARKLKQPRSTLLSAHFADPPVEEEEKTGNLGLVECFGGPYLELRGPRKGHTVKLTTGMAHIKSKTDCWLTFEEYRELTQHIKSRFPFKYHGIPDDSVFWPGHLLHKMRLCMPPYGEYKNDKTISKKNIFQPINSVQASLLPAVAPRVVWPTNEAGYVQLGDNGKKSYAL